MPDRLADLLASTQFNGIDFVEIATSDQTGIAIHFLNSVPIDGTLTSTRPITIVGGESVPTVEVNPVLTTDWHRDDDGRPTLNITTVVRGDFSMYRMAISSSALDPFYANIAFTFKAGCPSVLDCIDPEPFRELESEGPPIDYLAKDFDSFRAALLDYSSVAYPSWVERDEPDVGIMLLELLASVGDDLSYLQDRVAAEGSLATASQRRSIVRHSRLVDYEPRPAISSQVLLQIDVTTTTIPTGGIISAPQPDGTLIDFQLGSGLVDDSTGGPSADVLVVDPRWNANDRTTVPMSKRIVPYVWDDAQECLPIGTTTLWISGHGFDFPVGDSQLGTVGLAILIDTAAPTPVDPPIREVVHLIGAAESVDPLYGVPVTRLAWDASEALKWEHVISRTSVAGNLVPASQGRRYTDTFVIGATAQNGAVVVQGADSTCESAEPTYLHTLERGRLAWLRRWDGTWTPEALVLQRAATIADEDERWLWRRSLLDAGLFERAFTIEPSQYRDIRPNRMIGSPWWDYDGDVGDSIRFGDGAFGDRPEDGSTFDVTYRVGQGAAGNVGADAVTVVEPALQTAILSSTNPFAATDGADEESNDHVRRTAPYEFRARQFRALLAADYDKAADELPWVETAGTSMRWTGSWLTVFTTAEPRETEQQTLYEHIQLIELLDRRRIAGYEVYAPDPVYVSLDLIVTVCARQNAFRGEVERAIGIEIGTRQRADGHPAFFAHGQFVFGTPLERSELEAAIQRASGVGGVTSITYRRRGYSTTYSDLPETVTVGINRILRVDNDQSLPEHGSLRIVVDGGK